MNESPVERSAAGVRATGESPSASVTSVSDIGLKRALAVAEEAAFLWVSRSAVARSSAVTFDVLARMDQRLSRLVYKLSERPALAAPFLQHDPAAFESGLTFVTAIVALRGRVVDVFDQLLARLESEPDLLSPLTSALTWLDYSDVRAHVERLLAAPAPALLHLGLVTAVAHRVDPGRALARAVAAADAPALRASALKAIGCLAVKDLRPKLHIALGDEDATCRFWAAWSALRLGDRDAIPVLGRFAADRGSFARPACEMALRALDTDQALHAQQRLQSSAGNERLAIAAAGIIGDPTLATWLVHSMESPSLARRAGAAFCLMTGCDLRRDDLDADRPSSAAASAAAPTPVSEPEETEAHATPDADVAAGEDEADDELAWPDTTRLRTWWERRRQAFVPGIRYVAGLPTRPAEMTQVLSTGNQQQRAAAALELALLHPEAPLLDVTAPAHRQIGRSARPA
ncbi:MAG TPA: TIGR02270 family protein [Vicinamibacterales bacterium]|jgi:uncharacterized protein (TIGR02270 family)|nr:TIGR02270 family protein [Vicinamibacterales bacterium]